MAKYKIKNIPDKIYLNLGLDKEEMIQNEDFEVLFSSGEITWCQDKINDADIEYLYKEQFTELIEAYEELMPLVLKVIGVTEADYIKTDKLRQRITELRKGLGL